MYKFLLCTINLTFITIIVFFLNKHNIIFEMVLYVMQNAFVQNVVSKGKIYDNTKKIIHHHSFFHRQYVYIYYKENVHFLFEK